MFKHAVLVCLCLAYDRHLVRVIPNICIFNAKTEKSEKKFGR